MILSIVLAACFGLARGFAPASCVISVHRRRQAHVTSIYSHTVLQETPLVSALLSEELRMELEAQDPNEQSPPFDINNLLPVSPWEHLERTTSPITNHFEFVSLDDLFPDLQLSHAFNTCADFRNGLREAIRHDMVFDDQQGIYNSLSTAQRHAEVARNKPLIGLWKIENGATTHRMTKTTEILRRYLGPMAPTGDEFLEGIGALCNSACAPFHWTEVVGVAATQNKKLGDKTPHAWHQDYGCLEQVGNANNKHVFLGFPAEDDYHGTGVLPHILQLKQEQWIQRLDGNGNKSDKPMFYQGDVPEEFIVRPFYAPGRELIVFRDIDVLHSTPDIQFRTSLMRFG